MTHSLDPKDWSAFRARARDMLESVLDHMETYGEGPVWQSPDEMESRAGDLSETGRGAGATDDGLKALLPYGVGNTSPRFFGWVHGAGTPSGDDGNPGTQDGCDATPGCGDTSLTGVSCDDGGLS